MMVKQLPENLHQYFWDIKIETFNPLDYPEYTISRILELGDKEAVLWLKDLFSESQIKNCIKSDRRLSPKSANFWAIMFNIPFNEVTALKERNNEF